MGTYKVQNDIQTFVSNLPDYDTLEDAIRDMDGKRNTQINTNFVMGKGWYSSTYCMYHIAIYSMAGFPAGNWWLPSMGEWAIIYANYTLISRNCVNARGDELSTGDRENAFRSNIFNTSRVGYQYYWTIWSDLTGTITIEARGGNTDHFYNRPVTFFNGALVFDRNFSLK